MENNIFKIILAIVVTCIIYACAPKEPVYTDLNNNGQMDLYEDPTASLEDRISDVLNRLTLEEKVGLCVGMGMNIPGLMEGQVPDKVDGVAGNTFPLDTLGLPSLSLGDGPAGLRILPFRDGDSTQSYYCTAFPIETLLASSWDTDLVEQVGQAMGSEVLEYGADILLAPALNIHRNPRSGRNFEYYSEDPLLSGKLAAAMVNGVESNNVGTSIKHFVANNQETNRMLINTIVSERALREIYLKGFEITVKESQPWTVMSSYNKVNDIYTPQNPELLTTILRDEWGFEGIVMTDWLAGEDPVAMMEAGNDLIMPGFQSQNKVILDAIKAGSLDESIVDRNAGRIIRTIFLSPTFNNYQYKNQPKLDANAEIARKAASEGTILLKNEENALPFSKTNKVATFGVGSYDFVAGGTGSGDVNEPYTVSLVQGFENASINMDADLMAIYDKYIEIEKAKLPEKKFFFELLPPIPEMPLDRKLLSEKAKSNDLAFITIGRNSGEFKDREIEGDLYLTEAELNMIDMISTAFHNENKKVVVILNIGNVIETASWKNQVDAIVLAWQGGQEAGNAVVDVLTGKVNPSGKLPTTFPVNYEDVASAKNFPGVNLSDEMITLFGAFPKGFDSEVIYEEDIYIGYRYFASFNIPVSFPFGHGLSYTSFSYDNLIQSATEMNSVVEVSVDITNNGQVAGKEVAQLYISAPGESMNKPAIELKGFDKTKLLAPGASETLSFTIQSRDLASFDSNRSAWVVEPGEYVISLASSSEDMKLSSKLYVSKEIVVEKCNPVLKPTREINALMP